MDKIFLTFSQTFIVKMQLDVAHGTNYSIMLLMDSASQKHRATEYIAFVL